MTSSARALTPSVARRAHTAAVPGRRAPSSRASGAPGTLPGTARTPSARPPAKGRLRGSRPSRGPEIRAPGTPQAPPSARGTSCTSGCERGRRRCSTASARPSRGATPCRPAPQQPSPVRTPPGRRAATSSPACRAVPPGQRSRASPRRRSAGLTQQPARKTVRFRGQGWACSACHHLAAPPPSVMAAVPAARPHGVVNQRGCRAGAPAPYLLLNYCPLLISYDPAPAAVSTLPSRCHLEASAAGSSRGDPVTWLSLQNAKVC